jgi:hypothetical protein
VLIGKNRDSHPLFLLIKYIFSKEPSPINGEGSLFIFGDKGTLT